MDGLRERLFGLRAAQISGRAGRPARPGMLHPSVKRVFKGTIPQVLLIGDGRNDGTRTRFGARGEIGRSQIVSESASSLEPFDHVCPCLELRYNPGFARTGSYLSHGELVSQTMKRGIWFCGSLILSCCAAMAPSASAATREVVLYNFCSDGFPCLNGASPVASLVLDAAGNLYGTSPGGGAYGQGTAFRLSPDANGTWTETILYSFCSAPSCADGYYPQSSLVFDSAGDLYGTTQYGGSGCQPGEGCGTVFELTPNPNGIWTETVLWSFMGGADGVFPEAALILDSAGNLYGTTAASDSYNLGTVFELVHGANGTWTKKIIHSFDTSGNGGGGPFGLVFDSVGNLYGVTGRGGGSGCGGSGCGTAFELEQNNGRWIERVLHRFNSGDGAYPDTVLIFDAAGNLYGTTSLGGADNYGLVFQLSQLATGQWVERVIHTFQNNGVDGYQANGGLTLDAAGHLYGTTGLGGAYDYGTVFGMKMGANGEWTEKVLHSFDLNGSDGAYPSAGLTFDAAGRLYGATNNGGLYFGGTMFEIAP
jgi:uncharacterized repeat protein (TIGR03803 family)